MLRWAGDEDGGGGSDAEAFVVDLLADGPVPAKEARRAARDAGVADRTLDRIKKKLGVRSQKHGRPGGPQSWCWTLAPKIAEDCHAFERRRSASFGEYVVIGDPDVWQKEQLDALDDADPDRGTKTALIRAAAVAARKDRAS